MKTYEHTYEYLEELSVKAKDIMNVIEQLEDELFHHEWEDDVDEDDDRNLPFLLDLDNAEEDMRRFIISCINGANYYRKKAMRMEDAR